LTRWAGRLHTATTGSTEVTTTTLPDPITTDSIPAPVWTTIYDDVGRVIGSIDPQLNVTVYNYTGFVDECSLPFLTPPDKFCPNCVPQFGRFTTKRAISRS